MYCIRIIESFSGRKYIIKWFNNTEFTAIVFKSLLGEQSFCLNIFYTVLRKEPCRTSNFPVRILRGFGLHPAWDRTWTNFFCLWQLFSAVASNCQLLSAVVNCDRLLSAVASCFQLLSTVVSCFQLLHAVVSCCQLLSAVFRCCLLLSAVVSCCQPLAVVVNCCQLLPAVVSCWQLLPGANVSVCVSVNA